MKEVVPFNKHHARLYLFYLILADVSGTSVQLFCILQRTHLAVVAVVAEEGEEGGEGAGLEVGSH